LRAYFFAVGEPDQLERQPRALDRLCAGRNLIGCATEIFWSRGTGPGRAMDRHAARRPVLVEWTPPQSPDCAGPRNSKSTPVKFAVGASNALAE